MPSFQHAQLPYPGSDQGSKYAPVSYGFPRDSFANNYGYAGVSSQDLAMDPYDNIKHGGRGSAFHYPISFANAPIHLPIPGGSSMLPPLQIGDRCMPDQQSYDHQLCNETQYLECQVKEEKAIGGVSAKLDYEMEQMTDFVAEMTVGLIKPGMATAPAFRKWVLQVLNATRLPSATILLSLSYLTLRVRGLRATGRFVAQDRSVYQLLIVALILGSKFLDDNTFQNKSWAEVSNIPVGELNKDERDWLSAFGHRLHNDSSAPDGFAAWEEKWISFKAHALSVSLAQQAAVDAELRRQQTLRSNFSPVHVQQQKFGRGSLSLSTTSWQSDPRELSYSTMPFSPYSAWDSEVPASSNSPSSASHTGPNTPDFYAVQSGWGSFDPYTARQSQYGFGSLQQPTSNVPPPSLGYSMATDYGLVRNNMWSCHSSACQCASCRMQSNFFQPRYGPIAVG